MIRVNSGSVKIQHLGIHGPLQSNSRKQEKTKDDVVCGVFLRIRKKKTVDFRGDLYRTRSTMRSSSILRIKSKGRMPEKGKQDHKMLTFDVAE